MTNALPKDVSLYSSEGVQSAVENFLKPKPFYKRQLAMDSLTRQWMDISARSSETAQSGKIKIYRDKLREAYRRPQHTVPRSHLRQNTLPDELSRDIDILSDELNTLLAEFLGDLEFLQSLPVSWDEDAGGPYGVEQTFQVEQWLRAFIQLYKESFGSLPMIPRAGQAENQSIDLTWSRGPNRLLVNLPEDGEKPCTFHAFSTEDPSTEFEGRSSIENLATSIKYVVKDRF